MIDILAGLMVLGGGFFILVAAVGVLRMPDLYVRMHAGSKAGTLGAGLMLGAVAVYAGELSVTLRALAAVTFLVLTAPIGAHLLTRASYIAGVKPWDGTKSDDLAERYDEATGILASVNREDDDRDITG
jgi:multicomponent Na+:H+ antiporter subunit G